MTPTLVLAVLAVAATLAGAWDKLVARSKRDILLGTIVVAIAILTQGIAVSREWSQAQELADANVLLKSGLSAIDEASGGATLGNTAYIVDDDEPGVFKFEYDDHERRYRTAAVDPIDLVDERPCPERLDWVATCDGKRLKIKSDMLQDLEGAAIYNNTLYLVTSHANSRQGKEEKERWLFAEVTLEGKILRATRQLRGILAGFLVNGLPNQPTATAPPWPDDRGKQQVMQVEGLAIDAEGRAFIGLRAPLIQNRYAILFRAPVQTLFDPNPPFEVLLLELRSSDDGSFYGIVSLDYDPATKRIVILGNHPSKVMPPHIWHIDAAAKAGIVSPTSYTGHLTTVFDAPGTRPAKPEVLLVRNAESMHLFFDAEGTGGQIAVKVSGTKASAY